MLSTPAVVGESCRKGSIDQGLAAARDLTEMSFWKLDVLLCPQPVHALGTGADANDASP